MSFSKLPEDLIEYIMMNLSPYGELQVCRLVSKRWNRLCHGAALRLKRLCDRCDSFEWLFLQQPQELTSGKYAPNIAERCSHAACYHAASGSIFVFGGCTAAYTTFNDLWKFDLATRAWKRPIPGGTPPTPKACATMVEYRGKLAIFGGWSKSSPNPIHQTAMFFNELHIYDPVNNDWRSMENDGSAPHLAGHSATLLGHQMIVFGGSHGSGSSNNVPPQGNLIPPRRKLISSRSLDEQNSPPSPKSEERKTAELQRARSIPTIIVGEIPKLVVTAEDNSGDSSGSDSSTSEDGSRSPQYIAMVASSLLPNQATQVQVQPAPVYPDGVSSRGGLTSGRSRPSVKPNASKNREKQLEMLRKMEKMIRSRSAAQEAASSQQSASRIGPSGISHKLPGTVL